MKRWPCPVCQDVRLTDPRNPRCARCQRLGKSNAKKKATGPRCAPVLGKKNKVGA